MNRHLLVPEMMQAILLLAILTMLPTPAAAQSWVVDYTVRVDISQTTKFYGNGSFLFLKTPTSDIPVYLQSSGWQFQGVYGQVALPDGIPPITFTGAYDQAVASQVSGDTKPEVGTPELAILNVLPAIPDVGGAKAALRHSYQHATAVGAAGLLRALGGPVDREGMRLHLRRVTVHVIEWCSGVDLLKFLLLGAAVLFTAARLTPRRGLLLVLACFAIALEVNILRTTAVSIGYETWGPGDVAWMWKERFGVMAVILGAAQVGGLAFVLRRRP
jgi:exosortase/archaeosortase family protein